MKTLNIAIRYAMEVFNDQKFVSWAAAWLDGSDRSKESVYATYAYVRTIYTAKSNCAADVAYAAYAYAINEYRVADIYSTKVINYAEGEYHVQTV